MKYLKIWLDFIPKGTDYFHLDTLVEALTHDYPE